MVYVSIQIYILTTSDKKPYLRNVQKAGLKNSRQKKNLLADPRGNAVSNFFNSIFIVKQVVLLFSGINVQ